MLSGWEGVAPQLLTLLPGEVLWSWGDPGALSVLAANGHALRNMEAAMAGMLLRMGAGPASRHAALRRQCASVAT